MYVFDIICVCVYVCLCICLCLCVYVYIAPYNREYIKQREIGDPTLISTINISKRAAAWPLVEYLKGGSPAPLRSKVTQMPLGHEGPISPYSDHLRDSYMLTTTYGR